MRFKALVAFRDLQDSEKLYEQGGAYPRPANKKVKPERLEELLGSDNALGRPVIGGIEEDSLSDEEFEKDLAGDDDKTKSPKAKD